MNKIGLIIQREYWVRVRKKSFIIMTLLGPILSILPTGLSIYFSTKGLETKTIEVLDESGLLTSIYTKEPKGYIFKKVEKIPIAQAKEEFKSGSDYGLLYIPNLDLDKPEGLELFTKKNVSIEAEEQLRSLIRDELENQRLLEAHIDKKLLEKIKIDLSLSTKTINEDGETSGNSVVSMAIGFGGAFFLYISLFIYGVQVMRGVIEEKTNRIIEVIISSVKPFQLMMGKIIGIGLVGITQFTIWIILSGILISITSGLLKPDTSKLTDIQKTKIEQSISDPSKAVTKSSSNPLDYLDSINVPLVLGSFLFYFIGGYLFYSSLFAAVGSAVDVETDTQQFMLPITMPIIFSFIAATFVVREPDSGLAFWLSIIPFSSPIVMMVRLPFLDAGDYWQLALSMVLLIGGFIATTWLASRIYRVGILMYGKKVSFKELYKWLFYKI